MGNSIIKSYIKVSNVVKLKLFTCYDPEGEMEDEKQGPKVFIVKNEIFQFSTKQKLTQKHTQIHTQKVSHYKYHHV